MGSTQDVTERWEKICPAMLNGKDWREKNKFRLFNKDGCFT